MFMMIPFPEVLCSAPVRGAASFDGRLIGLCCNAEQRQASTPPMHSAHGSGHLLLRLRPGRMTAAAAVFREKYDFSGRHHGKTGRRRLICPPLAAKKPIRVVSGLCKSPQQKRFALCPDLL
ncbi:hypothetical protein [Shinella sp. HZN7]|uniref:hypothetical protein n=1 Tax=Shinella sp. (strain HZN7) TaxID=879274 RepID=UPI0011AB6E34|nr:hypothetical protein [Shinella sp. HZN7]